jgi:hypothetical protein
MEGRYVDGTSRGLLTGTKGIGLHIDTYKGKPVATYLTIYHGLKHVILLPPTGNEYSDFFGEDYSLSKTKPFPLDPSPELIERIKYEERRKKGRGEEIRGD